MNEETTGHGPDVHHWGHAPYSKQYIHCYNVHRSSTVDAVVYNSNQMRKLITHQDTHTHVWLCFTHCWSWN